MTHDQNFKNLILDYPREAIALFAASEAQAIDADAQVTPVRQEQLQERLGEHFRELDVPLLVEWPDGRREAILFVIEQETEPARFSVHRLVHYCLDLSELLDTRRVVPVVVFLNRGDFPSEISLCGDSATYLACRFLAYALPRIPAREHFDSRNLVARLNLPNMAYAPDEKLEVYAQAIRGLTTLEPDPERRLAHSVGCACSGVRADPTAQRPTATMEVLSDGTAAYHRASLVKRCVSIKGQPMDRTREDAGGTIHCSGRAELAATWFISLFLVGFIWVLCFVFGTQPPALPGGIETHAFRTAITVAAVLVTLAAAGVVLTATRNWRLLGPARLQMDPFPAGVGGEAGGVIQLAARFGAQDRVVLALQCIRRRRSGSGQNSSWHETVLWEQEGMPHMEAAGRGTRLVMRFPIPAEQPPSRGDNAEEIVWRLYLQADLGGRVLRRQFTLPVGDDPRPSRSLQSYPLTPGRPVEDGLLRPWVRETRQAGQTVFLFPAFRHLKTTLSLAGFGLLSFGAAGGVMLWMNLASQRGDPPVVFPVVFLFFAFLMVLPVFWLPFSLQVFASPDGLRIRRYWLGLPVGSRQLARPELSGFSAKSGTQVRFGTQRHEVFHHLVAHTQDGRKLRCSAGLPGPTAIQHYEHRLKAALDWRGDAGSDQGNRRISLTKQPD
jgi:hypothetical protein